MRAAIVLVVLVVTVACGYVPRSTAVVSPAPSFVPWLPLPTSGVIPQAPSPSPAPPAPIPAGTPECPAGQLDVALGTGSGATGHLNIPIWLRNRGSTECFLQGYPDVTILDAAGRSLAQAIGSGQRGTFFDYPDWVVPILMRTGTAFATTPYTAPPQGQARFNIEWYDCSYPTAAKLLIDLPDRKGEMTLDFPVKGAYYATCDGAGPKSSLTRGMFTPTGIDWPPLPNYLPVTIALDVPASVAHGSSLTYFVTLANTGSVDYRLSPCPDYVEFVADKQGFAQYRLNCSGAGGHIAPDASARFEMKIQVPRSMPAGITRLQWGLLDFRIGSLPATATIAIT